MVEGNFHVAGSALLDQAQKQTLQHKLAHKISSSGFLQTRSQVHRSQLENKEEVIRKINAFIERALKKEKKRVPTRPTKSSREKRMDSKKKNSQIKDGRRKLRFED